MNKQPILEVLSKPYVSQTELVGIMKYLVNYVDDLEKQIEEIKNDY